MHTLIGYRLEMHGKYILQLKSYGEYIDTCYIHNTSFKNIYQGHSRKTK